MADQLAELTTAKENNPVATKNVVEKIKGKKKKEKKEKKSKKNKVVTFTEPQLNKECFANKNDSCSSSSTSPLLKSIKLNYKTVLLQLLAIYFIKGDNYSFLGSVLTVLLAMAFSQHTLLILHTFITTTTVIGSRRLFNVFLNLWR